MQQHDDVVSNMADGQRLVARRPLSAFLSYWRGDAVPVAALQHQLTLRGVAAWRDITDLEYGGEFVEHIRRAIREEVAAFVAYVTPKYLTRDVIWNVEVPEALSRHRLDPNFQIIPIFCGVSPSELAARCAALGLEDLSAFTGDFLPVHATKAKRATAHQTIARKTLRAGVRLRFAGDVSYESRILLRSGAHNPGECGADLDLDWSAAFGEGCPVPAVWDADLLPALRDVRDAVSTFSPRRHLHVQVQARLSAAIALGETFPAAAKYTLTLEGTNGEWTTAAPRRAEHVLTERSLAATGADSGIALVEVSISRAIGQAVAEHAASLSPAPSWAWRLEPIGGAGQSAVEDASWAISAAWQVGDFLRRVHDEHRVRQVHLYVAAPAEWCVLVGHTLNAVGQLVVYQRHPATGAYERGCALGATPVTGQTAAHVAV